MKKHLESSIEKYMREQVELRGGLFWKFVSPNNSGVPDRIVVRPDGWTAFVELKQEGEQLRPLQRKKMQELHDRKAAAFAVAGYAQVDAWLAKHFAGYPPLKVPSKSVVLDYPEE